MSFKDHFSGHADRYGAYRPSYPAALFEYLASLAPSHELAWDCATGNGQAAVALAPFFRRVVATDASARQIAEARAQPGVEYRVAPAERTDLADGSADLVTVAQALHWLDLPAFYAEVRRVCRPGAIVAVWTYQNCAVSPEVDAVVARLYDGILGDYWPPERKLVEQGYWTLAFPFEEIEAPTFPMVARWDLRRMFGYLDTWSSNQRYQARHGADPVDLVRDELAVAWGDADRERGVVWPFLLKVGRVSKAGN
jgi:SAM-dependent methyltransferase